MGADPMRISATVHAIAGAIATSPLAMSRSQQARIEVLRLMPAYTEIGDLGAWEEAYGQLSSAELDTRLDPLLDAVFEFGRYNLYCQFDPVGSKRVYTELFDQLRRAEVACPTVGDFAGF